MTTMMTLSRETAWSFVTRRPETGSNAAAASSGELSNLLQVAASVLHLIDRHIDDEIRPLVRAGLAAISAAGDMTCSPAFAAPLRLSWEG